MRLATAQNIRRTGLAIEALSLLGLLTVARRQVEEPKILGIVDPGLALMIGLGIGFAAWLVGTALIYWPKRGSDQTP